MIRTVWRQAHAVRHSWKILILREKITHFDHKRIPERVWFTLGVRRHMAIFRSTNRSHRCHGPRFSRILRSIGIALATSNSPRRNRGRFVGICFPSHLYNSGLRTFNFALSLAVTAPA